MGGHHRPVRQRRRHRRGRAARRPGPAHRRAGDRRDLQRWRDERVLGAVRSRAAAAHRGRGRAHPGQMPAARPYRAAQRGGDDRADQARRGGRRGLRRRDQPLLPARLRRGPLPVVRPCLRERGHRGVAVRHQLLGGGPVHRADRAAGRDRERGRHQGGPRPRQVPGAAVPVRRADPGLLAARGDLAGEHDLARPAGLHVLGRTVPVPGAGLAADARVHQAGAGRGDGQGRRGGRHPGPGPLGGGQVASGPRAPDRRHRLDQGLGRADRHVRRPGAPAADLADRRRARRPSSRPHTVLARGSTPPPRGKPPDPTARNPPVA